MKKISDLRRKAFSSDIISNCFFVENLNTPRMYTVSLSDIFDEIIKRAKESGLTVELKGDKIYLIK